MLNRRMKLTALILCIVLIIGMVAYAEYEPFKVKLGLFERLIVLSFYQQVEGSFATLKIVRELQMELAPTEEEYKLAGLQDLEGGGVNAEDWLAVPEKEIVFGDKAKEIIVNALIKLDKDEKLRQEHFSVYEKFVLE
ncbi:unnamed protein product, partial [marine sediment metagenome]